MLSVVTAPPMCRRTRLIPADVQRAVLEARIVCSKSAGRADCMVAWDCVEELSNELARQIREEQEAKVKEVSATGRFLWAHSKVLGG